ncbi:DUF1178 family protein [Sphingomonas jatrophae]|uniref:Uncharacterized protein n=1 Tax=Sphingomonas jatrophae TaxID=1166337 RepID=A0A1I6JSD6_9SPHN|nr:DUF1178 family protein [Sphingomonas jatrophae]SFR81896.1 hypothetical protein SAMN05192580_0781 [Sphingomonas jatrophae]
MILFDLACAQGHVFEGWFGSSDDYEHQRARGLVSCPMCGAGGVEKAVMAPRVAAKGNQAPSAATVKAVLGALAKAQAKALEGSDYVGPRFAAEARAMHEGATPHRTIHGQASLAEARALVEDGVPVAPLPLPVRPPGTDN